MPTNTQRFSIRGLGKQNAITYSKEHEGPEAQIVKHSRSDLADYVEMLDLAES